jgi:hypothetical protein
MADFTVEFQTRNDTNYIVLPQVEYKVNLYSWQALGGPDFAKIDVFGQDQAVWEVRRLLRSPVTIFDKYHRAVWWGYVQKIYIEMPEISVGISLDEMYNQVTVTYSQASMGGAAAQNRLNLDPVTEADSISEYGTKEVLVSNGDATEEQAQALADLIIDHVAWPVQSVHPGEGDQLHATIECRGWWETFDWQLYDRAGITMKHDSGVLEEHTIGTATLFDDDILAIPITPASAFDVQSIWIYAGYEGTNTDALRVSIRPDSGGVPDLISAELAAVQFAQADLSAGGSFVEGTFGRITLAASTQVWITMKRTGTNDDTNYWFTDVDTDKGYGGNTIAYNGSTWAAPTPDGDLMFMLMSVHETSEQINYALTNAAQFITDISVEVDSGIYTYTFRGGDNTTLYEILKMLEAGTDNSRRMLANIDKNRRAIVTEEPAKPTSFENPTYRLFSDGEVRPWLGDQEIKHLCPVGDWIEMVDVPPLRATHTRETATMFFIERAEYNVNENRVRLEPRGAKGLFDLGENLI